MNHQQERGIAPIWIVLSIIVVGIVALFIYGIVNRPPNQHIGNGKPWNEHMSQGSADAKNVFIDYTDYFCYQQRFFQKRLYQIRQIALRTPNRHFTKG